MILLLYCRIVIHFTLYKNIIFNNNINFFEVNFCTNKIVLFYDHYLLLSLLLLLLHSAEIYSTNIHFYLRIYIYSTVLKQYIHTVLLYM